MNNVKDNLKNIKEHMIKKNKREKINNSLIIESEYKKYNTIHMKKQLRKLFNTLDVNSVNYKEINSSIMEISRRLTPNEMIYFKGTFLENKSEKVIAEEIRKSKTTIQKIKHSCILKSYVLLGEFCEGE